MYARRSEAHLDDHVLALVGVESVLNVALSDDADVTNDLNGGRTKHVVLVLWEEDGRQRERRKLGREKTELTSERVWEGAITIESPVCVPRGSKFCSKTDQRLFISSTISALLTSMLQQMMTLSAASRTTSYSSSFHPFKDFSMRTWGERERDLAERSRSSSSFSANPEPSPPSEKAERRMTG